MEQLINKDALVVELEKRTDKLYDLLPDASKVENGTITISEACNTGKYTALESFRKYIDTLEVKEVDNMPNIRFPHYKSIVEKVFGAGNLESFEYHEAEQLVLLAKEELLKDLKVKEVDLEKEIDKFYGIYRKNGKTYSTEDNEECLDWKVDCNPDFVIAFAKHFYKLGLKTQKGE